MAGGEAHLEFSWLGLCPRALFPVPTEGWRCLVIYVPGWVSDGEGNPGNVLLSGLRNKIHNLINEGALYELLIIIIISNCQDPAMHTDYINCFA